MSKELFHGISQQEVEAFKERLAFESSRNHRFAAIQIKGNTLAEKDITFHKTAFEACKYILLAPTDKGLYTFRSMSLLEDDVKRTLEGKGHANELDVKRSKGLDLER